MRSRPEVARGSPDVAQRDFMGTIEDAPSERGNRDVIAVSNPEIFFRESEQKGDGIMVRGSVRCTFHQDLPIGDAVGQEGAVDAEAEVHLIEGAL